MSGRKVVTPHFEILRRGEVIKTVPLHRSRLVIGSEGGADLRLKHPAIASRHLEVSVVQGRYLEARNLAGEGRVLLGGAPMDHARLREGDELDLGPVSLRLSYQRSEKPVPSSAPAEEAPTDADAPAPTSPDEDDEPTVDEPVGIPPRTEAPSNPTGSRLGRRRRTPPGPRAPGPTGMDLDLDDIPLDPVPLVTIEPPGGKPQRVPLRVGSFVVGGGRCAFRLSYPGIAPAHAEMMVMPDGLVYLKHLAGAGQVTLRNGAPIQFSRWKSGDRVQVGPVTLALVMVPQAELADVLAKPVDAPRKPSQALPRLEPGAPPPPRPPSGLVAAPRSSALDDSSVPDPLAPQPWSEPAPTPPPAPAAAAPPTPQAAPEPLPPPPSAEPPAPGTPPPPATPLVRVRRKGDPPKKKGRALKQASSPLVQANPVQISLDVRAADTYRAHARGETSAPQRDFLEDDDLLIDYRPAWWRRMGVPLLIGLLLLVIAAQYFMYREGEGTGARSRGPQVAAGEAGVERDAIAADNAGGGRLVIGDPRKRRARGGAAGGGGGDEWEPDVEGRFAGEDDGKGETDALARLAAARADAALYEDDEPDEDSGKPTSSGGGTQGWVEMKEVEKVMWDNRKALGYCYQVASDDNPDLEGILWLSLTLAADGRIRGAVVEPRSSVQDASLLKCLQRQLFRLDMPTPRGGSVTFSYPFELTK